MWQEESASLPFMLQLYIDDLYSHCIYFTCPDPAHVMLHLGWGLKFKTQQGDKTQVEQVILLLLMREADAWPPQSVVSCHVSLPSRCLAASLPSA